MLCNWKLSSTMVNNLRDFTQILQSGAFQCSLIENHLQPWWKSNDILPPKPTFWWILVVFNWNFFQISWIKNFPSTMVKNWKRFYQKIIHSGTFQCSSIENFRQPWWKTEWDFTKKSFNPVHFRSLELKIFFNHGEKSNEILPPKPSLWCVPVPVERFLQTCYMLVSFNAPSMKKLFFGAI